MWSRVLERVKSGLLPDWRVDPLGAAVRGFFQLQPGQLQLVQEGAFVLGSPTQHYEGDLSRVLEELGIASEFESFKLVCNTGDATRVGVILRPRGDAEGAVEVAIYWPSGSGGRQQGRKRGAAVPRPRHALPIRVRTDLPNDTRFVNVDELEDPSTFSGQLEIVIREAAPAGDGEQE